MNADPEVMRWFPSPLDRAGSDARSTGSRRCTTEHGFTAWAVEVLDSERGPAPFVGFVGLVRAAFAPPFDHADPCVEVGWRLDAAWWGLGIATEAATEALRFALRRRRPPRDRVVHGAAEPRLAGGHAAHRACATTASSTHPRAARRRLVGTARALPGDGGRPAAPVG